MDERIEISPADIRHKEFSSGVFGYSKTEVREYLDMLAEHFEEMYAQRMLNNNESVAINVRDERAQTQLALEQMQKREELIAKTMIQAETTRNEIVRTATKEAENIIKEAELSAKKAIDDTNNYLNVLRQEFINMKENHRQYLMSTHSQLRVIMERLQQDALFSKEKEAELDKKFDDASKIKRGKVDSDVQ